MTLNEITEKVLNIVQDESFEDQVPSFVNSCLDFVTQRYDLDRLESSDTLTLSSVASSVTLPSNYMKGLYAAESDGRMVGFPHYYYDFKRFLRTNPERQKEGYLSDICVRGNELFYAKRCDAELDIRFFEKPTYLSGFNDEPECLPVHLHEPLCVNFAAWKIFDLIEDGIEDPKTNTTYYQKLFFMFLPDLELFEVQTEQPVFVQDEWNWRL